MRRRIAFASTMLAYRWGGSEELWSRTALELLRRGFSVAASVREWSPPHPRLSHLMKNGAEVWFRPRLHPVRRVARRGLIAPTQIWKHAWRILSAQQKTATTVEIERLLAARRPELVVISDGGTFPPIDLLELCVRRQLPFVTIHHANWEAWWLEDKLAERYRKAFGAAQRCYFVSKANQRLAEKQIGSELVNAEVVWSPVNLDSNVPTAWPRTGADGALRLACVGRLDPPAKGQDILLEALAGPLWAARPWRLYLYGDGPMRDGIERLVRHLGLADRVIFAGHVRVEEIWSLCHVLVMASRYEGLPLTIIEAMLCGRPVVATDVAGNAEVVEDDVSGFLANAPTVASVAEALERLWARRRDAKMIGHAGFKRIRQLLPSDPVQDFADKLADVCLSTASAPPSAVLKQTRTKAARARDAIEEL